jgi:hypothetical protein
MDWPSLEEKCRNLLANPEIRKQDSELKYLVIDYTQFDDWSSEDDIMDLQNNGIGENRLSFIGHRKQNLYLFAARVES